MKLGTAFSDSVFIEAKKRRLLRDPDEQSWWLGVGRALSFGSLLAALLFVLLWRLLDLTVIRGFELRSLSDTNRTRELVRHAPRGRILDRTGNPLVTNAGQYRLLRPCEKSGANCVSRLSQAEGEKLLAAGLPPGYFVEVDFERKYLYPTALSHVVGFIGELSAEELSQDYYKFRSYRLGDKVGRSGVEEIFEEKLRGRDGKELVEVDAAGRILRALGRVDEIPGEDIHLSLDADIVRVAAEAFPSSRKGAVVVSRPDTGEILTLFSNPSFDPNAFERGLSKEQYTALLDNPGRPLFDRATGGVYPPGSTFKLITATAALEEGVVTPQTTIEDTGFVTAGAAVFRNWYFTKYGKTDGKVNIITALQRSNDIYFYKIGEALGIEKLAAWASLFGLGKPLGIELTGEASGLMPDPGWKAGWFTSPAHLAARDNQWYTGDIYNTAIGQGYVLASPLQVNFWTDIIANEGKLCRPTIIKNTSLNRQTQDKNKICPELGIKKENIALVTAGMRKACEPGGTGWPLFNFKVKKLDQLDELDQFLQIPVACKTGTAEFGDPQNHTHAWFTAFAPLPPSLASQGQALQSENEIISGEPEISVTVLVEGAGEGSDVAAPIAKKIFEEWFSR